MDITKASGEREVFERQKFCDSLKTTGAPEEVVEQVCEQVERELHPGMTTSLLFRVATRHLMKANLAAAARYNLRRGVAQLGPAGFLFEQYMEVVLREMGYTTKRNQMMEGVCVTHEVDIVAHKGSEHYLLEAKYRNKPNIKTSIDVVMYADARLQDIEGFQREHAGDVATHHMWVVTNTKFTKTSIRYAKCKDIRLMGWNYPQGQGLQQAIEEHALYPVTALPSVTRAAREKFAGYDMMLVRDLAGYTEHDLTEKFGIHRDQAGKIMKEARALIYGEA